MKGLEIFFKTLEKEKVEFLFSPPNSFGRTADELFEKKFSKFCGAKYAISCANGTDALTLALKSLNLPRNSEVIIPAMTYCSTAFSVIEANLKPILVDTGFLSPTICIEDLKRKINKKTKVIIPVHLYGSAANLKKIKEIIKKEKIFLIEGNLLPITTTNF